MMAELPQPTELPRDALSIVGLINSRAKEIFFECWTGNSGLFGENRQARVRELVGWLSLVLIVPVMIYGTAELALFGTVRPTDPVRSELEADYGVWDFVEIRRVKPTILDEIRKDRPNEIMDIGTPANESGFVGIHESMQEPEREGSQSGSPISPTPFSTGVGITPSSTTTESPTPDLTPTLIFTPTAGPTFTPMATDTPTPTPHPTNTPVPTNPPPTGTSTVMICHKPGEHQKTLSVPESEVAGHLGHGDYLGPCNES